MTWSKLATTGAKPPARTGHTLSVLDGKLVLIGGAGDDGVPLGEVSISLRYRWWR